MSTNLSLNRRYGTTHEGHDVELEFNKNLVMLNRARLRVDGELVDTARIFYGTRQLTTALEDGTNIVVRLHSGMYGELVRAQLCGGDNVWIDLQER